MQVASLPKKIGHSSMVLHNGNILLCGGLENEKKCLQLVHNTWKEHSALNTTRKFHSAVTTKAATFIFGGHLSHKTYEYLPKDSTMWLMGKTEIPGFGFLNGCGIAVKSDKEVWLIGGVGTEKRILSFNVNEHTFEEMPFQLNVERYGHTCEFIPRTNKIMITGGNKRYVGCLDSTEILDVNLGLVTMGSKMSSRRCYHGMGILTINDQLRLAVFGGRLRGTLPESLELYNTQTGRWETSNLQFDKLKSHVTSLTVKLGEIMSKL